MRRSITAGLSALVLALSLPGQPGLVLSAPVGTVARLQPADGGASTRGQTSASADLEDVVTQDAAEAVAADLEAVREAHGWTTDELAAYEASEAALDSVTERLSTDDPHAFVGSALADDPTEPPTVYVKGRAPVDIRALASELGVTLVEDQPYSLQELDTRLAAVQDAVFSAGFEDFVVSADIEREGAITLIVAMSSGASLDPVLAGIAPEIAKDITVIIEDDPVVEPQGAFGGMKLQDGGVFECTSGWTVRRIADGVRGVSGAGHCDGIDQINHPGHGVHAAFFQQEHVGQWGDVEWYTTNEFEADDFYSDELNQIRDVAAVEPRANIASGESICVYGRASNRRDCSLVVENPDVFCGWPQQKLVQMNGAVTIGGDSGGGWSFGNTAYGGHYGLCWGKSSFSVADLFDEALGVAVAVT
jgi:streptogrisin C